MISYSEWKKLLFIEDAETTGGAVPRTAKQLHALWDIYKSYEQERVGHKLRIRKRLLSNSGRQS